MFVAGSTQAATTYVRGYVRPSGDGDPCFDGDTNPCVSAGTAGLEVGNGTSITDYQIVGITGIVSGTTVDFTFAGPAPANAANSTFQVLVCGYPFGLASPGIYDSTGDLESTSCTQLGPTVTPPPSNFITDDNCSIVDTVCLTFSGTGLPSSWFFTEDLSTTTCTITDPNTGALSCTTALDGPFVTGTTVTQTTATPEPASMTLLAAGLGLGALRRKRAA